MDVIWDMLDIQFCVLGCGQGQSGLCCRSMCPPLFGLHLIHSDLLLGFCQHFPSLLADNRALLQGRAVQIPAGFKAAAL